MIKRLIGVLVTLAVLAVVVVTILHRDRYRSMLRFGEPDEVELTVQETLPAPVATRPAAEPSEDVLLPDSL